MENAIFAVSLLRAEDLLLVFGPQHHLLFLTGLALLLTWDKLSVCDEVLEEETVAATGKLGAADEYISSLALLQHLMSLLAVTKKGGDFVRLVILLLFLLALIHPEFGRFELSVLQSLSIEFVVFVVKQSEVPREEFLVALQNLVVS